MNETYVLMDEHGFFCYPRISTDRRTQNVGHAALFSLAEKQRVKATGLPHPDLKFCKLVAVPVE